MAQKRPEEAIKVSTDSLARNPGVSSFHCFHSEDLTTISTVAHSVSRTCDIAQSIPEFLFVFPVSVISSLQHNSQLRAVSQKGRQTCTCCGRWPTMLWAKTKRPIWSCHWVLGSSSICSNAMERCGFHAIFACCLPPLKCAKPSSQGEVIMLQVGDHFAIQSLACGLHQFT